jgi:hypothetical protein
MVAPTIMRSGIEARLKSLAYGDGENEGLGMGPDSLRPRSGHASLRSE